MSQEFSKTENRILGALARLDDFLMNPLLQGHSGTAPETSRNALSTSQGTKEDDTQSDPHAGTGIFYNQMTQNSGPEDGHDRQLSGPKIKLGNRYLLQGSDDTPTCNNNTLVDTLKATMCRKKTKSTVKHLLCSTRKFGTGEARLGGSCNYWTDF